MRNATPHRQNSEPAQGRENSCRRVGGERFAILRELEMVGMKKFEIRGSHITLDALVKALGIAATGGEAKMRIAEGEFRVNGEVELRRGRKLRPGDVVEAENLRVELTASDPL